MKKLLTIFIAASLLCVACDETKKHVIPEKPVDNSAVSLSEYTIEAGPEGGEFAIPITSNAEWRVSGHCEWATPTNAQGKNGESVVFNVQANDGTTVRKAEFKLFSGSAVKRLSIVSHPNYFLNLTSEPSVFMESEGGELRIKTETNIETLEAGVLEENVPWLKFRERVDAFGSSIFIYDVEKNDRYTYRGASAVVKAEDGKEVCVSLTQDMLVGAFTDSTSMTFNSLEARDIEIKVKTNLMLDPIYPSWMTLTSSQRGETQSDGLTETVYNFNIQESRASRSGSIKFNYIYDTMLEINIRQINPNAVFAEIPDSVLRARLAEKNYIIIGDPSDPKCEVTEYGQEATSISIDLDYYPYIKEVSGFGAFKKLSSLTLPAQSLVQRVDLSDCHNISMLDLGFGYYKTLEYVNLGDNPVKVLNITNEWLLFMCYNYNPITVIGEKIETINAGATSGAMIDQDKCEYIDVTGCPALKTLNAYRVAGGTSPLKYIYVTSAQKLAYDEGTLKITKPDSTEVKIKD